MNNQFKIAVAVVYTPNWIPLAQVVLPNLYEYCQRHGYGLYVRVDPVPYNGFSKFTLINYLFKTQGVDFVLSLDLDTLITNHNIKIEDFISQSNNKSFYVCRDLNGINCGSFILKNNKWSKSFLSFCLSFEGKVDCEQNAVDIYMGDIVDDLHIKILQHPSINSYKYDEYYPSYGKIGFKNGDIIEKPTHKEGNWEEGDFILHVPGQTVEKRIEVLKNTKIIK